MMKEVLELLEEVMDLDENTLDVDAVLEDVEEWDSLSKLSLMAEAKKMFGKKMTADDIKGFVTVKDICDYLQG